VENVDPHKDIVPSFHQLAAKMVDSTFSGLTTTSSNKMAQKQQSRYADRAIEVVSSRMSPSRPSNRVLHWCHPMGLVFQISLLLRQASAIRTRRQRSQLD